MATLGSILLASTDADRLRRWYEAAFEVATNPGGFLEFGAVAVLIDQRDDVADRAVEPKRVILNVHVDDGHAAAARLDEVGVEWVVPLEERPDGWFGTAVDPDGNLIQVIELSAAYREAHGASGFAGVSTFSGFSVDDLGAAARFYGETLGLPVLGPNHTAGQMGIVAGGREIFVYEKPDHTPASFTILNFQVEDVDEAVEQLARKGVTPLRYDGMDHEANGVYRVEGPPIAWFTDPAGNVLSVIEETGPLVI
jgi:predicted enzyme related to lactoylglutathione lyase